MPLRSRGLSGHFSERSILFEEARRPLATALLRLGESIVEAGRIRRPLDFYQALANNWVGRRARPSIRGHPPARALVCDVCTGSVRKVSGALAVSRGGIRIEPGLEADLLFLVASPTHADSGFRRILSEVKRILRSPRRLEMIARCTTAEEVQVLLDLCRIEREAALPER